MHGIIIRLARRTVTFVIGAVSLAYLLIAGLVVSIDPVDFPLASGSPIGFLAAVFALFFSTISSFLHALLALLNQPVNLWELIVAGFLIVGAVKAAITNALAKAALTQ
jgi:hypothetical protein